MSIFSRVFFITRADTDMYKCYVKRLFYCFKKLIRVYQSLKQNRYFAGESLKQNLYFAGESWLQNLHVAQARLLVFQVCLLSERAILPYLDRVFVGLHSLLRVRIIYYACG